MLKSGADVTQKDIPVAIAIPIGSEDGQITPAETDQDLKNGQNPAFPGKKDSLFMSTFKNYSPTTSWFLTKEKSELLKIQYQEAIKLIGDLIDPLEVKQDNLDETVKKFEALIDFFLSITARGSSFANSLNQTIQAIFTYYMKLSGFYPKLIEKIKKLQENIENNNKITNLEKRKKDDINSQLKEMRKQNLSWFTDLEKTEIKFIENRIFELSEQNIFFQKKIQFITQHIESLKKITISVKNFFPNDIHDATWHTEVLLSIISNYNYRLVNVSEIHRIIRAIHNKDVTQIFTLLLHSCRSYTSLILLMPPKQISRIINMIKTEMTYDQAQFCQKEFSEAHEKYLQLDGPQNSKYKILLECVNLALDQAPAPSAPPLSALLDIEQDSAMTHPSIDTDDDLEEFYDTINDVDSHTHDINYAKLLVEKWKENNPDKAKESEHHGKEQGHDIMRSLGFSLGT